HGAEHARNIASPFPLYNEYRTSSPIPYVVRSISTTRWPRRESTRSGPCKVGRTRSIAAAKATPRPSHRGRVGVERRHEPPMEKDARAHYHGGDAGEGVAEKSTRTRLRRCVACASSIRTRARFPRGRKLVRTSCGYTAVGAKTVVPCPCSVFRTQT